MRIFDQTSFAGDTISDAGKGYPMFSTKKVLGYDAKEFTRANDLGVLPELWKVSLIAGDEVVCTSSIAAFNKHVIGRV